MKPTMDDPGPDALDLGEITTSPTIHLRPDPDDPRLWEARVDDGAWYPAMVASEDEILEIMIRYPDMRAQLTAIFGRPVRYTTRED